MRLAIDHTTRYTFSGPVAHGVQRLRLTPKATSGQRILSWTMHFTGGTFQAEYDDENRNHVTLISFDPGVTELSIRCEGVVDTNDVAGVVGRHYGSLPLWHFQEQTDLTRAGARTRALLSGVPTSGDPLARLHALSGLIRERVAYEVGHTDAATAAEGVLAAGHGVCQDHAHVFIASARALGFPARYVSGYLMMDGQVNQEAGHAWAEAHVETLGWVGFDISNGISPDERYVRVATGRDYRDAAPITGIHSGARDESMHVTLAVEQQRAEQ